MCGRCLNIQVNRKEAMNTKQTHLKHLPWVVLVAVIWLQAAATLLAICNTKPTAQPDTATVADAAVVIDVLANDDDADGQALEILVTDHGCPGVATVELDLLRYDPGVRLMEDCEIKYQVRDEAGLASAPATVLIQAAPLDGLDIFNDGFETGNASAWSLCQSCG